MTLCVSKNGSVGPRCKNRCQRKMTLYPVAIRPSVRFTYVRCFYLGVPLFNSKHFVIYVAFVGMGNRGNGRVDGRRRNETLERLEVVVVGEIQMRQKGRGWGIFIFVT